jgi:hypothetical protein
MYLVQLHWFPSLKLIIIIIITTIENRKIGFLKTFLNLCGFVEFICNDDDWYAAC